MKKEKNCVSGLTWALDGYRLFWPRVRRIPHNIYVFFSRIVFLLKHGYSEPATWDTDNWFIIWAKEILTQYKTSGCTPVITNYQLDDPKGIAKNERAWQKVLDEMLACLEIMEKRHMEGVDDEQELKARKRFFALFCKYFHNLWC